MKKSIIAILITSSFTAYSQTYDGTGSQLETAVFLGDSIQWMNLTSSDLGVIYRNNGSTSATNADLIVNYTSGTTPKFVIGGFNDQDDGNAVSNNIITIMQGDIEGSIYGGLAVLSQITENVDESNNLINSNNFTKNTIDLVIANDIKAINNKIEIDKNIIINDVVYGGNATLWLQSGTAMSGSAITSNINAQAYAYTYINIANDINLDANLNQIILKEYASLGNSLYGGQATLWLQSGTAIANDATASNAYANASAYTYTNIENDINLNANTNQINLKQNVNVDNSIYGGYAIANIITGDAIAGNTASNATKDKMTIFSSSNAHSYIKMQNSNISANNNIITLDQQVNVNNDSYGGYAQLNTRTGKAISKNSTINGGSPTTNGVSKTDINTNNSIITANNNQIIIGQKSNIGNSIYGGSAKLTAISGTASSLKSNSIVSENATSNGADAIIFSNNYINGYNSVIESNKNMVSIQKQTNINDNTYGGYAQLNMVSGDVFTEDSFASGNASKATSLSYIIYTNATSYTNTSIDASNSTITASNNTVTFEEQIKTGGAVYGGYANLNLQSGNASSGSSTATFAGVSAVANVKAIANAYAYAYIDISSSNININNNNLIIQNQVSIDASIYGGYTVITVTAGIATSGKQNANGVITAGDSLAYLKAQNLTVTTNGNNIDFNGSLNNGSIYAGYIAFNLTQGTATKADGSLGDNSVSLTGSRAVANNNIITLGEAATFSQTTGSLYGGYLHYNAGFAPESYNVFSGNTLNMNAKPLTVSQMGNFENYNFYINDNNKAIINTKTGLITVTDQLVHTGTITANSSTANVATVQLKGVSGTNKIKTGDTLVLIDATQAKLIQESLINKDGSAGTATMQSMFTAPSNKIDVGLTRTADVNYIITDNDTEKTIKIYFDNVTVEKEKVQINIKPLAEGRLATLMNVTRGADTLNNLLLKHVDAGTFTPIAIIDGGINKYHSGSYIDARDYRMMVGSRYQILDNFYTGLTFEYGRSNYNSYNNFTSGRVHGQGHTYNYGASLFGKYSHYTDNNEFYIDASFRIGRTKTEFGTNDIITGAGTYAHYNSKAGYMVANIGSGYIYQLNDKYSFDTSLRYFYTRLSADTITIDGDNVNFKTAHSSRLQLKEQFNYQDTDFMTFYLAGIYEYEFSGKAGASSSGISIDAPSVQGSTGMIELGVITTPIENNKDFEIKFAARAASGKRDGVNASMMFKYDF